MCTIDSLALIDILVQTWMLNTCRVFFLFASKFIFVISAPIYHSKTAQTFIICSIRLEAM